MRINLQGTLLFLLASILTASLTARIKPAAPVPGAKVLPPVVVAMRQSDCFVCHGVYRKLVGPRFKDVADKYRGVPNANALLVAKVQSGGGGTWGQIPMARHTHLKAGKLEDMVAWVLERT
jgi:cytochrome c